MRLPLLSCLDLALQAELLFLAVARQLGLSDLRHGEPAHTRGLAVGAPRGGGELLLLEPAILGTAGGRLGALFGVLLTAARRARLGALRRLPVGLLLGTRLPVAALRLRRAARTTSALVLTATFFGIVAWWPPRRSEV